MTGLVVRADARALPLPDASVDLVVTSPPYFALRAYTDGGQTYAGQIGAEPTPAEYLANLLAVTRECVRVLKPSGSMFWNVGDKYAGRSGPQGSTGQRADRKQAATYQRTAVHPVSDKSLLGLPWRFAIGCVDELGLILRRDIIWHKLSPLPESVTDRCATAHEYLFHFTKKPHYFAAVDAIREPHVRQPRPNELLQLPGGGMSGQRNIPGRADYGQQGSKPAAFNPLGRLPRSVWPLASEPFRAPEVSPLDGRPLPAHYAAFPTALVRRVVLGWSPSGICVECGDGRRAAAGSVGYACACPAPSARTRPAVVLDPFSGTGTTVLVASAFGRAGIGVDHSHDYGRLARWRTADPGQRAKAAGIPRPPARPAGQAELFEGFAAEGAAAQSPPLVVLGTDPATRGAGPRCQAGLGNGAGGAR